MERPMYRLPHAFQSIMRMDDGQHASRISPLFAFCPYVLGLSQTINQSIKKQARFIIVIESRPKLDQDCGVKARVSQLQAKRILPINSASDSIRSSSIGKALSKLKNGDHRESAWRLCRTSARRKEIGKDFFLIKRAKFIPQFDVDVTFRKSGLG